MSLGEEYRQCKLRGLGLAVDDRVDGRQDAFARRAECRGFQGHGFVPVEGVDAARNTAGEALFPWKCFVDHDGVFDSRMMYYATEELWFEEHEHGGRQFEHPEN